MSATTSDECVTYFTKTTQYDIPVRQINQFNSADNPLVLNPVDTWYVPLGSTATEYGCIGLKYTPGATGQAGITGYIASYMTIKELNDYWNNNDCVGLFNDMLQGGGTSQTAAAFSASNYQLVQDDFNFLFSRYFNHDPSTGFQGDTGYFYTYCVGPTGPSYSTYGIQNGGKISGDKNTNNCEVWIGGVGEFATGFGFSVNEGPYSLVNAADKGFNKFLPTLISACQNVPGACAQMQEYMCSNCNREQILASPILTTFCGCVAPAAGPDQFYNASLQNYDSTCDPLCNRIETIKQVDPTTGVVAQCNASVCVMDAVTINSIASTGTVPTFNQVCPACADGKGNCICVIDATFNTTIPSVKGVDGISLNTAFRFTQYCPNSQCYINNPVTGQYEEVECAKTLPKGTEANVKIPLWIILVVVGILIFVFLMFLAYKFQSNKIPVYLVGQSYSPY